MIIPWSTPFTHIAWNVAWAETDAIKDAAKANEKIMAERTEEMEMSDLSR